jgi:hypothetical protein
VSKIPPVGPKLTPQQLLELTDLTGSDGRKYHGELPATWDNAEWVANHPANDPKPHFPSGHEENENLKKAIAKAFIECKKIDPTDPNGAPWLLGWRMYPNAAHPMWKDGMPECGCNCGCFVPRDWASSK